jgi:hypothetical protein
VCLSRSFWLPAYRYSANLSLYGMYFPAYLGAASLSNPVEDRDESDHFQSPLEGRPLLFAPGLTTDTPPFRRLLFVLLGHPEEPFSRRNLESTATTSPTILYPKKSMNALVDSATRPHGAASRGGRNWWTSEARHSLAIKSQPTMGSLQGKNQNGGFFPLFFSFGGVFFFFFLV